jgi:hypothetical protein
MGNYKFTAGQHVVSIPLGAIIFSSADSSLSEVVL